MAEKEPVTTWTCPGCGRRMSAPFRALRSLVGVHARTCAKHLVGLSFDS